MLLQQCLRQKIIAVSALVAKHQDLKIFPFRLDKGQMRQQNLKKRMRLMSTRMRTSDHLNNDKREDTEQERKALMGLKLLK